MAKFRIPWFRQGHKMSAPGFLDSISPWASRSNTPKPGQVKGGESGPQTGLSNQYGADRAISRRSPLSLRDYPNDCPKSTVKWFYAVDVRITISSLYALLMWLCSSLSESPFPLIKPHRNRNQPQHRRSTLRSPHEILAR